jgi:hypothetical protein
MRAGYFANTAPLGASLFRKQSIDFLDRTEFALYYLVVTIISFHGNAMYYFYNQGVNMKKRLASLVLSLFCLTIICYSQSNDVKRLNVFYYLHGEYNGIKVLVGLNQYLVDWTKYLKDKRNIETMDISDDYLMSVLRLSTQPLTLVARNNSGKTIKLNSLMDHFIIANEEIQNEYQLIDGQYPSIILNKAKANIILSTPWDASSFLFDTNAQKRAIVIAQALAGYDYKIHKEYYKGNNANINDIITKTNDAGNEALFGDYILGVENIEIPLTLVISAEELNAN